VGPSPVGFRAARPLARPRSLSARWRFISQSRASCRRAAPETMKMGSVQARIAVVPWSGSRSKPTWCLEPAEQADRGSDTNPQLSPPISGRLFSHIAVYRARGRSAFRNSPSVMPRPPRCSLCCSSREKRGGAHRLPNLFSGESSLSSRYSLCDHPGSRITIPQGVDSFKLLRDCLQGW
jgi:hypothetical protein